MSHRISGNLAFGPDNSLSMPRLCYGTAWKKERTDGLVYKAMQAGFAGIDTAGGSEHYDEDRVRQGFQKACSDGVVEAKKIFIQSKLHPIELAKAGDGFDDYLRQSLETSLKLRGEGELQYLDALVLHGPLETPEETLRAWRGMERYVPDRIRLLGISNVKLDQLEQLYESATVKPVIVQNPFSPRFGHDVELRRFCREKGIAYQSFWTVTGNKDLVQGEIVGSVAEGAGVSRIVACYSLVLGLGGTSIMDGTSSEEHMKEDLEGIEAVEAWAEGAGRKDWEAALEAFKKAVGDL